MVVELSVCKLFDCLQNRGPLPIPCAVWRCLALGQFANTPALSVHDIPTIKISSLKHRYPGGQGTAIFGRAIRSHAKRYLIVLLYFNIDHN